MPAYLTHRAAGERVFENLKKAVIPKKEAFFLGCQGPDILFFRNYQPWKNSKDSLPLGLAMHGQKTKELLAHAMGFLRGYDKQDKDDVASYMAGFLTHYAIDKNAHPFVYGKAGHDSNIHHATESMWDSFTAKEQWGIEPQEFDVYSDVMSGGIADGVEDWYSAAAMDVYGSGLKPGAISQAQVHLAKARRALANIRLPHKALMKLIQVLSGYDLRAMLYPNERNDSLFSCEEYKRMQDMIAKGVEEAAGMIKFMMEYINGALADLPALLGEKNFAGETL
jgi:hypothetical protein